MAVSGPLGRLAAAAPAPVFPLCGPGFRDRVEDLGLDGRVELVASPRHATVLLVAGDVPDDCEPALRRIHDQLPHPRAALRWRGEEAAEIAARTHDLHRHLVTGETASEDDLLPDEPPNRWRGEGDHGQGGEGMMGGTPYGRPMAMTDDDLRDGLALDALTVRVGPFLPVLPPGLTLELTLQGDVVQSAGVRRAPFAVDSPKDESARAGSCLRHVARVAALRELSLLARRLLAAARRIESGEPVDVGALRRAVRRSGLTMALQPGLGGIDPELAGRLGGHAGRAARGGGDVRSRVRQWFEDAAEPPGDRAPAGDPPPAETLGELLVGLEWGQCVAVLASFDEVALSRLCGEAG